MGWAKSERLELYAARLNRFMPILAAEKELAGRYEAALRVARPRTGVDVAHELLCAKASLLRAITLVWQNSPDAPQAAELALACLPSGWELDDLFDVLMSDLAQFGRRPQPRPDSAATDFPPPPPAAPQPVASVAKPPPPADTSEESDRGVSLRDAAMVAVAGDDKAATATVKTWSNSGKITASPIGKCPIDGRAKLYRLSEILSDLQKILSLDSNEKSRFRQALSAKQRKPTD